VELWRRRDPQPALPPRVLLPARDETGQALSKELNSPAVGAGPENEVVMASYCYEAVDASGLKNQGTLDVMDQSEALKRIKEMGLFPTKIAQAMPFRRRPKRAMAVPRVFQARIPLPRGKIKPAALTVFTRQLATLIDVGMPLMRGLRILQEQTENRALKSVIVDLAAAIESGSSLSEALAAHPKVFNPLYVSMVKAGEMGGVLELTLRRQAEFMEKALKIRGRIKAAMYYPVAVMTAAAGILTLLMVFIIRVSRRSLTGCSGASRCHRSRSWS